MHTTVRISAGLTLWLLLAITPAALAQNSDLQKALKLFEQQEYVASHDVAVKINRDSLNETDRAQLDGLMSRVVVAVEGSQRARQDEADAAKAYLDGRWDDADKLYVRVMENPYAKAAAKANAEAQRKRISERRQLSAAAQPRGPVAQPAQNTPPPAPAPTQQQAPKRVELQATPVQSPPPAPQPMNMQGSPNPPPQDPQPQGVVDELRRRDDLLWQRAVARMEESARQAREAIAANNYEDARRFAEQAIQVVEAARVYAEPVSKYEAALAAAQRVRDEVSGAFEAYNVDEARRQREEIARRLDERRSLQEQRRREQVEQLFNTAEQLIRERRFREAAETIRQVLFIDPANDRARYQLQAYEDFASFAEQNDLNETYLDQARENFVNAEEALIPWYQDVLYPRNWLEISARREGAALGVGRPVEDRELDRKLREVQPDVSFADTPFETAVEFLADLNKINISVDWEDLDAQGIQRDKPVTIKLREVSLTTVMKEMLSQVGGDVVLAYTVGEGLLRIATKDKLDRDKFVLVYDIRDLLVNIPRFAGPEVDITQATQNQGGQGGGGGGGGQGIFQDQNQDQGDQENNEQTQVIVMQFLDIISMSVEPESWVESGGGTGALRELNGQLIVYNTSDAQRQVSDLLGQLRETRALQIAVESRFLVVTSNFLESIGVDLDFVFNQGSAGFDRAFTAGGAPLIDPFTGSPVLVPRQFSSIGATPAVPAFGNPLPQTGITQPYGQAGFVPQGTGVIPQIDSMTPIGAQQGSISLADPGNLSSGVPGSLGQAVGANPGLSIAGSFLDNLQVDFLIRATQANSRSSIVQAPRLMLFNGQRAFVLVARNRSYVSSVTPSVAEGAVGVTPVIGFIQSGVTLDVEGTISADRKYTTLTVRTSLQQEPRLERFEVTRGSGNSPSIFVTLTDQEVRQINTTVSVPDGGTVLLGGLKQVGEVEVDAGVPILSKIPILKRAFTNSTTLRDVQTLLILLKSKIIIQREAEEEAFPTMVTGNEL